MAQSLHRRVLPTTCRSWAGCLDTLRAGLLENARVNSEARSIGPEQDTSQGRGNLFPCRKKSGRRKSLPPGTRPKEEAGKLFAEGLKVPQTHKGGGSTPVPKRGLHGSDYGQN